ncbi:MAG: class I SAM-dependent methyltransferase [Gammaproteobacteria bacterium]|nr:MAG: class I SAM-dependent methyltransferase [Gammaproteobacteria bacterium]
MAAGTSTRKSEQRPPEPMSDSSLIIISLLLVLLFLAARELLRQYLRRRQRNLFSPWPVKRVRLEEFDPVFERGPLGPSRETEVRLILGGPKGLPGGTSDYEAWILAVLARRAKVMFEFGTCTGRTTYLWARNSPPDARIHTITLPPEGTGEYRADGDDHAGATRDALRESVFDRFYYSGTPEEAKVHQIFGDSKSFDESELEGQCDLVFIDGSHAYSYVLSDSEKALRMVRPGGIILWHDYRGPRGAPDVYRALNELNRRLPLVHIRDTSLVAYRHG